MPLYQYSVTHKTRDWIPPPSLERSSTLVWPPSCNRGPPSGSKLPPSHFEVALKGILLLYQAYLVIVNVYFHNKSWNNFKAQGTYSQYPNCEYCHGKNGPTQMWSGDQFWQPKAVPPDQFWQPKVVPPRPLLAAKSGTTCQKWPPPSKFTEHALYHCKTTSGSQNGGRQPPSKMTIKVVPLHKEYPLPSKAYMLYQCKSQ